MNRTLRRLAAVFIFLSLAPGTSYGPRCAAQDVAAAPKGPVEKALAHITEDLVRKDAEYLASDDLEGRNSGFPGEAKAAEYIAGVMKDAGLKPVGDKDEDGKPTYWQQFKVDDKKTRNCLGLLEGSDPDLKKEIIVIGGHHDHLGSVVQTHWGRLDKGKKDDGVWNGADDNASGTSVVLALIRAFGKGGLKTKRSILFMTFSGEEYGLLGSRWYVNHPIAPIAQHSFMLNLDMVGRNEDRPVAIEGVGSAEDGLVRAATEGAIKKTGLKAVVRDKVTIIGGDSDHSSFGDKGVPFAFFFSGDHPDYHRVTDHADKLAYSNMVKIADTAAYMILAIADGEKSPRFKNIEPPAFGDEPPPKRRLGIAVGEVSEEEYADLGLDKSEGAVRVNEVSDDSVAEAAGLKAGDYILSVGGTRIGRDRGYSDLRACLDKVQPGKEVPIEIVRSKKKMTLKATWKE